MGRESERKIKTEKRGSKVNFRGTDTYQRTTVTGEQIAQATNVVAGVDGSINPGIRCFHCKAKGHYAYNCREKEGDPKTMQRGAQHMGEMYDDPFDDLVNSEEKTDGSEPGTIDEDSDAMDGNFMGAENGYVKDDVLLDTGSNCSVFNTKKYLCRVVKSKCTLRVYTNGGYQDSNYVGCLPGFFRV